MFKKFNLDNRVRREFAEDPCFAQEFMKILVFVIKTNDGGIFYCNGKILEVTISSEECIVTMRDETI